MNEDVAKLAKLIEGIQFAMMTTVAKNGSLHSRPMTAQQFEFDGELWFIASRTAGAALDLQHNPQVNVAFAKPNENVYVSVTGQGERVEDRERVHKLWSPAYKAWFPKGPDDPDILLLRVYIESAEYWDAPSSKLVQLIGFTKAVLTGRPAGPELGERKHIEFH